MSYLKLPKTTQDHAVGFQSVNQAIDNNAALLTAFDANHSIGVNGNSPYGFPNRAVGRHDDIRIARSVAYFTVDTTDLTLGMRLGGPSFGALSYFRIGVGNWRIFISSPQVFGVVATCVSTSAVTYKANCYVSYDPLRGPNITVTTWDIDTAIAEERDFSLALWMPVA